MSELDIIRAWKDKTYRNSLNADQLAQLPENPAGTIELTDDELGNVDGGTTPSIALTIAVSFTIVTISYFVGYNQGYNQGYQAGTAKTVPSCCPCKPAGY
jgi:mersacidin/lichenicidin family type 2 lantibiotic